MMSLGMILMMSGGIAAIVAMVMTIVFLKKDWNVSVEDFNRKFTYETSFNPGKIELLAQRKKIAEMINVEATNIDTNATVVISSDETKTEKLS